MPVHITGTRALTVNRHVQASTSSGDGMPTIKARKQGIPGSGPHIPDFLKVNPKDSADDTHDNSVPEILRMKREQGLSEQEVRLVHCRCTQSLGE